MQYNMRRPDFCLISNLTALEVLMAAPHVPAPEDSGTSSKKSSIGSLFDFLLALFTQSPPWLRTVIVLGIFSAAGFGIYRWISAQSENPRQQGTVQSQYPLDKGKKIDPPGNANNDPRNRQATQQVSDDDAHYKWHVIHEKH